MHNTTKFKLIIKHQIMEKKPCFIIYSSIFHLKKFTTLDLQMNLHPKWDGCQSSLSKLKLAAIKIANLSQINILQRLWKKVNYTIFYRCIEYSVNQMNGKDPDICSAKRISFLTSVLSRISSQRHPWISDDPPLREKEFNYGKWIQFFFTFNIPFTRQPNINFK